jgi:hypothetical protein
MAGMAISAQGNDMILLLVLYAAPIGGGCVSMPPTMYDKVRGTAGSRL